MTQGGVEDHVTRVCPCVCLCVSDFLCRTLLSDFTRTLVSLCKGREPKFLLVDMSLSYSFNTELSELSDEGLDKRILCVD